MQEEQIYRYVDLLSKLTVFKGTFEQNLVHTWALGQFQLAILLKTRQFYFQYLVSFLMSPVQMMWYALVHFPTYTPIPYLSSPRLMEFSRATCFVPMKPST